MAGFCKGEGSDFVLKEADKIWTLQKFFSKVPTNNQPFRFHFSKGTDEKLRVRIPAILRGRGGGVVRIKNGTSQTKEKSRKNEFYDLNFAVPLKTFHQPFFRATKVTELESHWRLTFSDFLLTHLEI